MSKISELKNIVKSGKFPNEFNEFGGANLIITSNANRNFHDGDIIIYSEHAPALSWLVIELKKIYDLDIDYINKYDFYPNIGKLIKKSLKNDWMIFESMLYVIEKIETDWGTK
jgi:hypothetical protein